MGPPAKVMRHSNGLPGPLSVEHWYRLPGRIMVNHQSLTLYQNNNNPVTMRVADLQGHPVGVLTLLGFSHMSPGSRCMIQLDLPNTTTPDWTPCRQLCACLQGEEIAIRADGTRQRARSHLLDTAHVVIPSTTTTTSVNVELVVPMDAPCSVQTDWVMISFECWIDLTVVVVPSGGYQNLRLQVPCTIRHGASEAENCHTTTTPLADYWPLSNDPNDPASFPVLEFAEDLQILSEIMARKCRLLPLLPKHVE